jgi:hypothetical protein
VVEHLAYHPEVQGLNSAAAAGTGRGKWCNKEAKFKGPEQQQHSVWTLASSSQGSGFGSWQWFWHWERENGTIKILLLKASCSSTVVEHLPYQPKVQSLKPVAATSTGRGEWCNKAVAAEQW